MSNMFKITIERIHAHKEEYGYHLQLCVGLQHQQEGRHQQGGGGCWSGAPTFIPFTLWGAADTAAAGEAPPAWWNADSCSMEVQPTSDIDWKIDTESNADYIELPAAEGDGKHKEQQQTIEFQLIEVKVAHGSATSNNTKRKPVPTVYCGNVGVRAAATANNDVTTTLVFGETATVTVLVRRLNAAEANAVKQAAVAAQRPITDTTFMKPPMLTLSDAAAAMSARASRTLQGSRVHRLLAEWSDALETGQLALMLSTLPFGDLLAAAAAGLFAAVMGRGAVLELSADLCGQTVLVLRVLVQPPVREMIITGDSTHSLLEQLLVAMEDTVRILEEYNASGAVAQLWSAGSILEKLHQQSTEMHRVFTLMFQLTSFRAHASNANDMRRVLEAVGAMEVLTTDSLCEHLLPQLLERLDNVAATTDSAVRAAQANGTAAIEEMLGSLLLDVTTMTATKLDERFGALEGSKSDAVAAAVSGVKDEITNVMSTVVSAASTATVSVLSHTMRSLLDDVVYTVLPSMMRDAVSSGLKEHLEGVVSDAWVAELQCGIHDTALLVQAHTEHTVSVATIQLGSQMQTLKRRLELASTAAADAMRVMQTTLLEILQQRISGAEDVVRNEALSVRTAVDRAHLSIADKIAVLHIEVTGLLGEVHLQRRVLQEIGARLDCMYEMGGAVLKKQTEITEVLDALPSIVRQALSRDVQQLHQQLRSHQSRTRDFVERLLKDGVSQLVTSYREHQALQWRQHRETERYLSQLRQEEKDMLYRQHDKTLKRSVEKLKVYIEQVLEEKRDAEQSERRRQHREVMQALRNNTTKETLLYNPAEDDGHHLAAEQRRYYAAYPLSLLQAELRCVYHELHDMETSSIAPSIELSRMGMYTSLRIMHAPSAATYRGSSAESYEGASMESTEVMSTMEAKGWRSLLVEGRAGIGKTTWAIHLAQLQNSPSGVVILLKLSDVAKYFETRSAAQGGTDDAQLSPRELLYISFGGKAKRAALVERLFHKMRTSGNHSNGKIVWLVDGLDEVISTTNPHLRLLLDAVDTAIRGKSAPTGIFCPQDMVVVASREERSGRLSVSQFVATINPWTELEAKSYIKTYFSQPSVRDAVGSTCVDDEERDAKLVLLKDEAVTPISEKRFGALSTLPLVLEMLCSCAMNGTDSAFDIVSLYKQTVDLKLKSARTTSRRQGEEPWTSSNDDIISLCMRSSVKTRDSVFFEINATEPACCDLLRSGLVREQFSIATANTCVRFVHKSFLEYFRALYFSTNLRQLDSIVCDDPVATSSCEHGGVECVVFSSPHDMLCIENPCKFDVEVTLQLQCVRPQPVVTLFDVIWLAGEEEKGAYEAALGERFTSRYQPKNTVTCTWATDKEPTKTIKNVLLRGTRVLRGKSTYFLVLRPVSGTSIVPVRCRWLPKDNNGKIPMLSIYNRLPLCDIPGYRQQRNFFLFLCAIVKNDKKTRQVLFEYLLRRIQYHHPRTASFMSPSERRIGSPLTSAVGVGLAGRSSLEADSRSKVHVMAEMGLSVLTECAALLLDDKADFGFHLKDIIERSSRFGRFTDFLNLRRKAIFDWALLPCARYGTWSMWLSVVRHASNECTNDKQRLLQEALIAAVVNGRYDVECGLVALHVTLDLPLACRLGAADLVVRELRKVVGAGDGDSTDNLALLTLTSSLSTLQIDTAAAVWEELGAISTHTVKVWRLIFASFTIPEDESWRVDGTVQLPSFAVSWLRGCFATLISRLNPSQHEAAEQCFLSTSALPYDVIQRAITLQLATFAGLLGGYQHFLTDETIYVAASKVPNQKVHRAVISNPSTALKVAIRERCTFATTSAIELTDCDVNDFLGALAESSHTLEDLMLINCVYPPSLELSNHVRVRVLAIVNTRIEDALIRAMPFFVALEDLTVDDIRRDTSRTRSLLSGVRSTLKSLNVSNVEIGIDDLRGPSFKQLESLTISNNRKVCDEFLTQLVVQCPLLVHLALPACGRVTDVGVHHIMGLQSLTSISLRGCDRITNVGVVLISSKKKVRSVDLVDCVKITDDVTSLFNQLSLKNVNLSRCGELTDQGLDFLSQMNQMISLRLCSLQLVTDMTLSRIIVASKTLTTLYISGCSVTDDGMHCISVLTALTELNISDCCKVSLKHVAPLHRLKTLRARRCNLSGDDLRHLHHCVTLHELDVSYTSLSTLEPISHHQMLQLLDVAHCLKLTGDALDHIAQLPLLVSLNAGGCVGIENFPTLQNAAAFNRMDLSATRMSVATLHELFRCTRLHTLNLSRCDCSRLFASASLPCFPELRVLDLQESLIRDELIEQLTRSALHLKTLNLDGCESVTDALMARLGSLLQLQRLRLDRCDKITDAGIAHLGRLPLLQHLGLDGCDKITDTGIACLGPLPLLQHLGLDGCDKITDAGIACLGPLPLLRHLGLDRCDKITDAGIAHLGPLPQLQHLDLVGCNEINDSGIVRLGSLPQLRYLALGWISASTDAGIVRLGMRHLMLDVCQRITYRGIAYLGPFPQLLHLRLEGCTALTDSGMAQLGPLPKLEYLALGGCDKITDAGIACLGQLPQLRHLGLDGCNKITDVGVAHLGALPHLQLLALRWGCKITDEGIKHFGPLPQLRQLGLGRCLVITDIGFAHLGPLPQLQRLSVDRCFNVSDAGFAHLGPLPQLQHLHVEQCDEITDAGIAHLGPLPLLQYIELDGCKNVTDAGIAHLGRLPLLQHISFSDCEKITDAYIVQLGVHAQQLDLSGVLRRRNMVAHITRLDPLLQMQRFMWIALAVAVGSWWVRQEY